MDLTGTKGGWWGGGRVEVEVNGAGGEVQRGQVERVQRLIVVGLLVGLLLLGQHEILWYS